MIDKIKYYSNEYKLDTRIVYGICVTESSLQITAARFEPGYRYFYNPEEVRQKGCNVITEKAFQATSWGIMQVMGAVYRELGFRGILPLILSDIDTQLKYGCMHLSNLKKRNPNGSDYIAAYNAGKPIRDITGKYKNQDYVNTVLKYSSKYTEALNSWSDKIIIGENKWAHQLLHFLGVTQRNTP